jgi:hypothetical protein
VNEKFEDFGARYSPAGLRVVRCSGDASDGVGPVLSGRYDLGFFTYEMFLNLALSSRACSISSVSSCLTKDSSSRIRRAASPSN